MICKILVFTSSSGIYLLTIVSGLHQAPHLLSQWNINMELELITNVVGIKHSKKKVKEFI